MRFSVALEIQQGRFRAFPAMKLYSDKIGPVEYFRGIGVVCFLLPYAMMPRGWPVCVVFSVAAYWGVMRLVRKEEAALRGARHNDSRIARVVTAFAAAMLANIGLIHLLR